MAAAVKETAVSAVTRAVATVMSGKYYYGWVIVAIAFLCNMFSSGTGGYGLGLFIAPMSAELGWSATSITFGQTMKTWMNGFAGPVLGPMIDRFGPRAVIVAGGILGGASFIALGWVQEPWQYYLLYSGFGAIGVAEFGGLVTSATIAKWFVRKRGQAMAYATMGVSMGGLLLIPVQQAFISLYGWRMAWILIGVMLWVVLIVPAFWFMRNRPEDMGLEPDGGAAVGAAATAAAARAAAEISWTLREALRTRSAWLGLIAMNLGSMGLSAMLVHNPVMIKTKGFSPEVAAAYASYFALLALVSKPVWGWLWDRYQVRYVNTGIYLGSAVGLSFMLAAQDSPLMMGVYATVYGFFIGAIPMLATLTWASYFGRAFIGTIQGVLMPFQMLSSSLAPLYAAWIVDLTGSYDLAGITYMAAYVIAALFMFFATKPVHHTQAG